VSRASPAASPRTAWPAATEHAKSSDPRIAVDRTYVLLWPRLTHIADGISFSNHPKEFVMDETLDLEVIDLGEARDVTKGPPSPVATEENPTYPERL